MNETFEKILEVLNEIRPELIAEGGDVKLAGFDRQTVYVRLAGPFTVHCLAKRIVISNIHNVLKERFPWIEKVMSVCPPAGFEAH